MGDFSMESMARVINRLEYSGVEFTPYVPMVDGKKKRRMKPKKKSLKYDDISGADLAGLV
jgi:hypothetical protein